ncbi:unnamed protein product [Miscanthus lutarioriparius]|uniref:Uncharacterized protein n=1 Tax=Miscanthus lutarioriparius TaxID=422564 RepID=A0A811N007_9POAL|nr:unnamed protein product [Miscanthus lutarioriparius]
MERRAQQPVDAQQPGKDNGGGDSPPPPPPFLEVTCRSSGKVRRFVAGMTACYALHAINGKLEPGAPPVLHVEAVRDGEEPVSFGPSAALADYGRGWRLQTVTAQDAPGIHHVPHADTKQGDRQLFKEDAVDTEAIRGTCIVTWSILIRVTATHDNSSSLLYALVVATSGAGYVLGSGNIVDIAGLCSTCAGTMMVAASANTLNQANGLVAGLAASNLVLYAFVYTPLKQIHPVNTWVGAVTLF